MDLSDLKRYKIVTTFLSPHRQCAYKANYMTVKISSLWLAYSRQANLSQCKLTHTRLQFSQSYNKWVIDQLRIHTALDIYKFFQVHSHQARTILRKFSNIGSSLHPFKLHCMHKITCNNLSEICHFVNNWGFTIIKFAQNFFRWPLLKYSHFIDWLKGGPIIYISKYIGRLKSRCWWVTLKNDWSDTGCINIEICQECSWKHKAIYPKRLCFHEHFDIFRHYHQ